MSQASILIRVPTSLRNAVAAAAKANDRSMSSEVRRVLAREFGPKNAAMDAAGAKE